MHAEAHSSEDRPHPAHSANVLDDTDWRYSEPTASFMLREGTPRSTRNRESAVDADAASASSGYPRTQARVASPAAAFRCGSSRVLCLTCVPAAYREALDRGRDALGTAAQSELALHILLALPIDLLMLRWIHAILKQPQVATANAGEHGSAAAQQATDRSARKFLEVENFGSDLAVSACAASCICAASVLVRAVHWLVSDTLDRNDHRSER